MQCKHQGSPSPKEIQTNNIGWQNYGIGILGLWGFYDSTLALERLNHHWAVLFCLIKGAGNEYQRNGRGKLRAGIPLIQNNAPAHTTKVAIALAAVWLWTPSSFAVLPDFWRHWIFTYFPNWNQNSERSILTVMMTSLLLLMHFESLWWQLLSKWH